MATSIATPPPISTPPHVGDGGSGPKWFTPTTQQIGMMLGLAAIAMMFIGLSSAYVVSQGLGSMWKQVPMYPMLWVNTSILLFSSYTLEQARRHGSLQWLLGTLALGFVFLAGQIAVFSQLAREGLYLNSGRQASFYYVLAGLHALHIVGGLTAITWAAIRMKRSTLNVVSLYWHFMDGLWLYLLLVIFL